MTTLIAGTVHIPGGRRDEALAATAALMEETRNQPGCMHYVWSADPTSESRVYVYEYWTSTEHLANHLAGPCYAKMLGMLGGYGVEDAEVSKFRIDLEEPVYDSEGKPRADFFTA